MNLEELVGEIPNSEQVVAEIDITDIVAELLGPQAEPAVWKFREPELPEIFNVPATVKKIKFQFGGWPDELCQAVALLAVCYVKAPSEQKQTWLSMAHLAKKLKPGPFLGIANRFYEQFPHLQDLGSAAKELKNASAQESST